MDILKIATSGSVDDGKSTLIGRLLYETGQVPIDKLEAIQLRSKKKGLDFVDYSLLTDGLIAEREQGITIDVAHIYFHTDKRKYIIADTPGHEEYTRNMVTGASQCETAIILLDARNGIVNQTKRHLFIASMMKLPHLIVAINKMDLINYDQDSFQELCNEFNELIEFAQYKGIVHYIPTSAKEGEGVSEFSGKMPWYQGTSLLEVMESIDVSTIQNNEIRFQVQHVIRPMKKGIEDYRGYAGLLHNGKLTKGDVLNNVSSDQKVEVKAIEKWGQPLDYAYPTKALTLEINSDMDISRGDWLVNSNLLSKSKAFNAKLTWLGDRNLNPQKRYLLQHGVAEVICKIDPEILHLNLDNGTLYEKGEVEMNDIVEAKLKVNRAIPIESFQYGSQNGSFILIDSDSNETVAMGLIS